MHQSIPVVLIPHPLPRANPRALPIFLKNGQIPHGTNLAPILIFDFGNVHSLLWDLNDLLVKFLRSKRSEDIVMQSRAEKFGQDKQAD